LWINNALEKSTADASETASQIPIAAITPTTTVAFSSGSRAIGQSTVPRLISSAISSLNYKRLNSHLSHSTLS
jgi:hypothetical protein